MSKQVIDKTKLISAVEKIIAKEEEIKLFREDIKSIKENYFKETGAVDKKVFNTALMLAKKEVDYDDVKDVVDIISGVVG